MRSADEERIALFLDYENLAIGARENLGGMVFDLRPVADALAERGRVVVRRAYADWLKFGEDGRMLTRHHVELIEIPQRMGTVRKNAADIKMAVDAIELCLERDYITTFVLGTGDSDFTPLVHKLREHNKQVIGLGIQMSTSALLPPACDEFLFYERLEGVELPKRRAIVPRGRGRGRRPQVGDVGDPGPVLEAEQAEPPAVAARNTRSASPTPAAPSRVMVDAENLVDPGDIADDVDPALGDEPTGPATLTDLEKLLTQTLAGLERASGSVRASSLKRAVLRKASTFSEADYGFRAFTELLRSLAERGVLELTESASVGDPDVQLPSGEALGEEAAAFDLLASVVERLTPGDVGTPLSGLKTQLRRTDPEFSEKRFGFGGFLQFAKAAVTRGVVNMAWNDEADDYLLTSVAGRANPAPSAGTAAAPTLQAVPDLAPATAPGSAVGDESDSAGSGRTTRRRGRRGRGPIGEGTETTHDHLSWATPTQPADPRLSEGYRTNGEDRDDLDEDIDGNRADIEYLDPDDIDGNRADSNDTDDGDIDGNRAEAYPAPRNRAGQARRTQAPARGGSPTSSRAATVRPNQPVVASVEDDVAERGTPSARTRGRRTGSGTATEPAEDTAPPPELSTAEPEADRPVKRATATRSRSRATVVTPAPADGDNDATPASPSATADLSAQDADAPEPKPRRRTTRKATTTPAGEANTAAAPADGEAGTEEAAPRRRRTRTAAPKAPAGDAS